MSLDFTNRISFTKDPFWRYVNIKIDHVLGRLHVLSVITILFEEIVKDLLAGKEIKIHNFGSLILKDTPPRRYHNVWKMCMMESPGYRILRFYLTKKLSSTLCKAIDMTVFDEHSK